MHNALTETESSVPFQGYPAVGLQSVALLPKAAAAVWSLMHIVHKYGRVPQSMVPIQSVSYLDKIRYKTINAYLRFQRTGLLPELGPSGSRRCSH